MPSAVRALSLVSLACLTAAALLGTAPAATADGGWSVVPAGEGRPYFYAEGEPGTVLQDTVSVINPTTKPLTVRLRGADADNASGGGLSVRTKAKDTGAWLTFARRTVRVPARTRADIPFTVSVPATAVPGDHPGAVLASVDGRNAAVRLQLRVAGPTLSALTVEHVSVDGGRISYELVNRGNTVLTPRLAVHADGLFGPLLDRAPRTLPVELLPGRRVKLTEPWPDAPAFDAADVRLTVTAAGGAHDEASASARFVPWGAVAGAGGLLAAFGAFFVVRHRRRRPPDRDGGAEQPRTEVELTGAVT